MSEFLQRSLLRKKTRFPDVVYVPHAETAAKLSQNADAPYHIWVGEPPADVNAPLIEELLPDQPEQQKYNGLIEEDIYQQPFKTSFNLREIPPPRGKSAKGKVVFTINPDDHDVLQEQELYSFLIINQKPVPLRPKTFEIFSRILSVSKKLFSDEKTLR
jgi:hypothetical protein